MRNNVTSSLQCIRNLCGRGPYWSVSEAGGTVSELPDERASVQANESPQPSLFRGWDYVDVSDEGSNPAFIFF